MLCLAKWLSGAIVRVGAPINHRRIPRHQVALTGSALDLSMLVIGKHSLHTYIMPNHGLWRSREQHLRKVAWTLAGMMIGPSFCGSVVGHVRHKKQSVSVIDCYTRAHAPTCEKSMSEPAIAAILGFMCVTAHFIVTRKTDSTR